ncbi:MAG: C25 family cysteine peptidase [Promethearchaeota archaeon]
MSNSIHYWGWKKSTDPDDVINFLNSSEAYQNPVKDAKVCAILKNNYIEFYIFYQRGTPSQPNKYGWKKSTDPNDVINFLNGSGAYQNPVKDAKICAVWKGNYAEFYVFYQRGTPSQPPNKYGWKKSTEPNDVINFLNSVGAYKNPVKDAEICAIQKVKYAEFYVFYQLGTPGQRRDNWSFETIIKPDQVKDLLTIEKYPSPIKDIKIIAAMQEGNDHKFYIFKPKGFLIVTRPMFVDLLNDYIQWKYSKAFEVYVVTAEWIQNNVEGEDLRIQIRNCMRHYYYNANVNYVVLTGDSVDIEFDPNQEDWQEPPPPTLSEPWNLPAGYYRWDCWDTPQFTTLYYSDLNDKIHYLDGEHHYDGDYKIYVGVMPVRTEEELQKTLTKIINYPLADKVTLVISQDLEGSVEDEYPAIQDLAGSEIATELNVFGEDSSANEIYEKLFETEGVIYEHGHGNVGIFRIGNVIINKEDVSKFQFINPLFIASSCLVQAYHLGESLDEAFLKAEKGPLSITSALYEEGFYISFGAASWEDLFNKKTIGQAFYDHCNGRYKNPLALFGDPSLIIFK